MGSLYIVGLFVFKLNPLICTSDIGLHFAVSAALQHTHTV